MKNNSGTSLFLIELVIMLTVFMAAAAINVLMLVRSNNMANESQNLDLAIEYAISAADCYKLTGSGEEIQMEKNSTGWEKTYDNGLTVYIVDKGDSADIRVNENDCTIYELHVEVAKYGK